MGAKRAVNLSLNADRVEEARRYGLNLSKMLDAKLDEALREERQRRWCAENAAALNFWNEELERNGLWSDRLRLF